MCKLHPRKPFHKSRYTDIFLFTPPCVVFLFFPQLNHLVEAQKRSSEQILDQFLEVSRSHSNALHRLEEQERSHRAFIHKSNCLTTLLEQDRERLVHQTQKVQMNA